MIIDLYQSGWADPAGGLSLYCKEAQLGTAYTQHEDTNKAAGRLLERVSVKLGKQCILGSIIITGREENKDFAPDDIRNLVPSPKTQPKGKRKTTPTWQPTEWGGGWK